jgi:tetratricopeptide (TPR) repeat protein
MPSKSIVLFAFVLIALLCTKPNSLWAQSKQDIARQYLDNKDYAQAAKLYKALFLENPKQSDLYQDYLMSLLLLKEYNQAEELVKQQIKRNVNNPLLLIDLANIYTAAKKEKKANESFEAALSYINGDDVLTQQMANALTIAGNDLWAIKIYERAIQITQAPAFYSTALARLYNKTGDVEKAVALLIESNQAMPVMNGDETLEASLLELIGQDVAKQKQAQKAIIKLVNTQPDNYYYTYLLSWICSIQNNWDQALLQVQALEKRTKDKGRLLLDLAQAAAAKNQFAVAQKASATVLSWGPSTARYRAARSFSLQMRLKQIQQSTTEDKAEIAALNQAYAAYLNDYPDAFGQTVLNDAALVLAQYTQDIPAAIALLSKAIAAPIGDKFFIANCKLQLGDYYLIQGAVWDAALLYAQVDKAFREDALGEEARFRNAKLSYYQNDFEQAQGQLSVLKASTAELIANDALYLSVLITENVPPDSNLLPLQRFAFADLLLFQNKDQEANALLDSIAQAFPKNPLADDILLLHSKIALKHKDYNKAIAYLKQIIEQHGKDVLADDATFQIAYIQQYDLNNKAEAQKYYEQLIIDYPGSSFVQTARNKLKELSPLP